MRQVIVCCAAALGLLLLMFGTQGQALAEEKPTSVLDMVPSNSAGFITFRVKDIWEDTTVKEFEKKMSANSTTGNQSFMSLMEQSVGIEFKQVDRVTMIMPATLSEEEGPLVIVSTQKPFDKEKLKMAIGAKGAEKMTDSGKAYYEGASPGAKVHSAIHFMSDTRFVTGNVKPMLAWLDRKATVKKEGAFKGANELIEKSTIAGIIDFTVWGPKFTEKLPPWEGMSSIAKAKTAVLTVSSSKETTATLNLTFADEDAAKNAEKGAQEARDKIATELADAMKQMEKFGEDPGLQKNEMAKWGQEQGRKLFRNLQDGLKNAKFSRKGNDVHVSAQAKESAGQLVVGGLLALTPVRSERAQSRPEK